MKKHASIFARDREWDELAAFRAGAGSETHLGVVYGRRRQGKSWLLERFASQVDGWYWEASQATARQQLQSFGMYFARRTGLPVAPAFSDWESAIDAVWDAKPSLIVFDEFQYLVNSSPELPSILQRKVARRHETDVIVCGSALGAMKNLLATQAPLRGRSSLELLLRPFDFRTAASYWKMGRHREKAMMLHALIGGTPAYRNLAAKRSPVDFESFDDWISTVLLNPAGALFREGRILTDESSATDRNLYNGILSAIAQGATRRGQIASMLGRPENTVAHPLNALVEMDFLERIDDPLRARRSTFRLAEPMLRTYQLLISPNESVIERRGPHEVLPILKPKLMSQVYGPHFENLSREWAFRFASSATLGGTPEQVGSSVVNDPNTKSQLEIDLVAVRESTVQAIGESKWRSHPLGSEVLENLELRKRLLGAKARDAKLLLFSGGGFDKKLHSIATSRDDIELIDLERLYRGE